MKPTNEERRDIAARLRELADANEGYLGMDRVNRVLRDGKAILGTSGLASVADVLRRHADLIEPDERTCRIVPHGHLFTLSDGTELYESACSECGAYLGDEDNYCSICGAKVRE